MLPVLLAYVPGMHGAHEACPLLLANDPMGHRSGVVLPIPEKKPWGVVVHCDLLCSPLEAP